LKFFSAKVGCYTRDMRLEAIGPGPQQLSWLTWQGDLMPLVQAVISAVCPALTDGPKLGQPYSAEQGPSSPKMLGTIFEGTYQRFRQAIVGARADGSAGGPDTVDVAEVLQHTVNLQNAMEDEDHKNAEVALHALQAASDAISRRRPRTKTGDNSGGQTAGQRESSRVSAALAQFQAGAAKLWGKPPAPTATSDAAASAGKVRDHLHAAHGAGDMRSKVDALNAAHEEFWSGRTADTSAPVVATIAPANQRIEGINKANAEFWDKRR
jgi:hypothetical protein